MGLTRLYWALLDHTVGLPSRSLMGQDLNGPYLLGFTGPYQALLGRLYWALLGFTGRY